MINGNPVPRRRMDLPRALAVGCMLLLMALSGRTVNARDRLAGDVQRVEMIGFTVSDVDRDANFFVTVLQFENVVDFRAVGSEYDKLHWQTTLATTDIAALTDRLRKAGADFITPTVVTVPPEVHAGLGLRKAVMVRDPTGHALRLVEE